jgi:hypothetical protein
LLEDLRNSRTHTTFLESSSSQTYRRNVERNLQDANAKLEQATTAAAQQERENEQLCSERDAALARAEASAASAAQSAEQIENLQQELDVVNGLHEQQLEQFKQQRSAAATEHAQRIATLLQQHAQQLAQMCHARDAALAQAEAAAAAAVGAAAAQHAQELAQMRQECDARVAEAVSHANTAVDITVSGGERGMCLGGGACGGAQR